MSQHACLTPPVLAKMWRVKSDRILNWIKSGQLRAFDVSSNPGIGRPRYRIPPDAITEFENRRSGVQSKQTKMRKRTNSEIIQFF